MGVHAWVARGKLYLSLRHGQQCCTCFQYVTETDSTYSQDRARHSLAAVWNHSHRILNLLMPVTGSTDPVIHFGGLTGLAKRHL